MDIRQALKALAELQAHVQQIETELRAKLLPIEAEYNRIKQQIKGNADSYENAVAAFKEQLQHYINMTGDQLAEFKPTITLRRRKKWMYDEAEALAWAKENAPDALKVTLDKRKFEKDHAWWFEGAEEVNIPEIALSTKLGHLLIDVEHMTAEIEESEEG